MRIARLSLILVVIIAGAVLQAAPARESAHATVLGQNGKIAFFGSLEGLAEGIVVIDPNGVDPPVQVTIGDDRYPDWSPDGTRIAFTRSTEPGIQIVNADGSHPVTLAEEEVVLYPRWSPDGTRIAYYENSFHSIVTINTDGSDRVDLGGINGLGQSTWSPGGSELAILDTDDGIVEALYGIAADGTGHRRLIAEGVGGWPDWSPDGRLILATGRLPGGQMTEAHIFAVDAFGDSSPEDLGLGSQPRWSPDGKRIVFTRMSLNLTDPPGQFYVEDGISMMNADGSGRIDLTPGDADISHGQINPSWQPLPTAIDSVEFTQAIQEWQTIGALQEDLADDGQPPVAMVAGKPAVMRVYFKEMDVSTSFTVEVSGVVEGTEHVTLERDCTPEQRRTRRNRCSSLDLYFTPPAGDWTVTLRVTDLAGEPVESHRFDLRSVTTNPLTVVPVDVCDHQTVPLVGSWDCQYGHSLWSVSEKMRVLFPGEVRFEASAGQVKSNTSDASKEWWSGVLADIRDMWSAGGKVDLDFYHGAIREDAPFGIGYIGLGNTPGHAGITKVIDDPRTQQVLAHELGHNFGRGHVPSNAPICYGTPASLDPGWPYLTPYIKEVGFDVEEGDIKSGDVFKDYMAYCDVTWVSTYTYNGVLNRFATSAAASASFEAAAVEGSFWLVSGSIEGDSATVDPVLQIDASGSTAEGTGDHRIEVQDDVGTVLVTRRFETSHAHWIEQETTPQFSEMVPVTPGAARLVVIGPGEAVLGEVLLAGTPPSVVITSPVSVQSMDGQQTLAWSVTDADSADFLAWVQYSTDGGATWEMLTPRIPESQLVVDMATIAGSDDAMFRVLVSDGANTGSAIAGPFVVPEKPPIAEVTAPHGTSFRQGQLVWLQALAFDEDDGFLDESAVTWSSSRDGNLGTGASLPVYDLSVGTHTITMTARDSDNNAVTDSIAVTVFDGPIVEGEPDVLSGDVDCSGAVNSVDALKLSRQVAGLPVAQTQPCPVIGLGDPLVFGDINCDGNITAVDTLFVLRFVAGMPVNLPQGCRPVGT